MKRIRIRQIAVVMVAAMLAACGDAVEGPGYKGVPLARLNGKLTAAPTVNVSNGVRLALAWYPSPDMAHDSEPGTPGSPAPMTQPKSIVTQDVVYQGSFPLSFTFDVYAPPPASAMSDYSATGGPQRAAIGMLLAYEDRNTNQKLDVIPATGSPIDSVVGASAIFLSPVSEPSQPPTVDQFAVLYIEGAVAADNFGLLGQPLVPGFNLVKMLENGDGEVVPLTTLLTIELKNDPMLDLLVCDALFTNEAMLTGELCGIHVGDPIPQGIIVNAEAERLDGTATIRVSVLNSIYDPSTGTWGAGPVGVSSIRLGTTEIPVGTDAWYHTLTDETGALLAAGGRYTLTIEVPDNPTITLPIVMPGDFQVLEPGVNAQIHVDQEFAVRWTASANATQYAVEASCGDEMWAHLDTTSDLSLTAPALQQTCANGSVAVRALNRQTGQHTVTATMAHAVSVAFVP